MATSTYNLIASQVVGSGGAASVTFSSIPGTYTDLKVVMSTRYSGASETNQLISINGSSSTFSMIQLYGGGTGVGSYTTPAQYAGNVGGTNYTANTFNNIEVYIPNYTSSNYKSYSVDAVTETNASAVSMGLAAGLWSTTSAITSLSFAPSSGSYVQYSTFYLYGIRNS